MIIGQVDHRHISIHALREEGDTFLPTPSQSMSVFLSTPSARRATKISPNRTSPRKFLSTPSARRATGKPAFYEVFPVISIHALREEGDFSERRPEMSRFRFLSTPSARRATMCLQGNSLLAKSFLSTPSARRATGHCSEGRRSSQISIHALREEGDQQISDYVDWLDISIHALREEGDRIAVSLTLKLFNFYPRPPRGGRPNVRKLGLVPTFISIHALREEGDLICSAHGTAPPEHFYPRPPRGGRRIAADVAPIVLKFLSTPSARRATAYKDRDDSVTDISIHALREEGDAWSASA